MTKAPNPIADRSWKKIVKRTVLVATTTLALTCLTVGVASYFRLIFVEPFDPAERWCVFSVRDGYARFSFSEHPEPPISLLLSPGQRQQLSKLVSTQLLLQKEVRIIEAEIPELESQIGKFHQVVNRRRMLLGRIQIRMIVLADSEYSLLKGPSREFLSATTQFNPLQCLLQVHLAIPFILFASYPIYRLTRFVQHRRRLKRIGKCARCGYDLTGNTSGVCSECGQSISERPKT